MSDKTKGNLLLLLTAMLWGTGFIAQKLGNEVMPPITFNAVRQLLAGLVLTPVALLGFRRSGYFSPESNSNAQIVERRQRLTKAGILCGIFMLIGTMTQQMGLLTVSAGKSGFISSIYIVFTPLFSVIVGSRVKRRTVFCIALAMVGFAVMSLKGGLRSATAGDWLTLISAAGFAAQIVTVNCFVDKDNGVAISQLQFLFCGIAGLAIGIWAEHPAPESMLAAVPVLAYITIAPTTIGYTAQILGQKYTDASTAALIMSLEAVFATIFGAVFLQEIMSMRELAGAAIIFAATLIGQRE